MLVLQAERSGEVFHLDLDGPGVRTGGEALVVPCPDAPHWVAKVYHEAADARANAAKLRLMVAAPPRDPTASQGHRSIAWPTELLIEPGRPDRPRGFLMPSVREETLEPHDIYSPADSRRKAHLVEHRFLHRLAANLCLAVEAVHARGHVLAT
jgi:DNA-binding helix-hairpin-helix protein with protein kinase domain